MTNYTQAKYEAYLNAVHGDPIAFIVSEDGIISYTMVCPKHADRCIDVSSGGATIAKGIDWCEQHAMLVARG
jgi:hypothetical protein